MKADWTLLERYRKRNDSPWSAGPGQHAGIFYFPRANNAQLICIASPGTEDIPWEHVSCRIATYKGDRCCTWDEMCEVKSLFWGPEERVVQFHPPESEYVNNHKAVLHLWKYTAGEFPFPPSIAVGIR